MRKLYTLLTLIITTISFAQAPQGINYQATIRNTAGELMINQSVNVKFNIIQGSPNLTPLYVEQHNVQTDDLGAIKLVVGQGLSSNNFSQIDWSTGGYFLGIDIDTGSGFVSLGTTQLLSVPYALYAEKSGSSFSIHINTFQFEKTIWDEQGQESTEDALYIKYNINPNQEDNYIQTGVVVGLNENVSINNNVYVYSTGGDPNQGEGISFSDDFTFGESDGLLHSTTYFIRGWVKKSDNTYTYGNAKTILTQP